MLDLDRMSYKSPFRRQDPLEKLFLAGLILGFSLWTTWIWAYVIVIGLGVSCLVFINKTSMKRLFKLYLIPIGFLTLGVLSIVVTLTPHRGLLWVSFPLFGQYCGLSSAGSIFAVHLFLRSLACVSCLYFLILTTPMMHIISALKRLKCPGLLIELMHLMVKMIFLLLNTTSTIYQAQKSRGGYTSLKSSYKDMATLASMTFIRAFRRADALYTALESRGYMGELDVMDEAFPVSPMGYVLPILLFATLVGMTLLMHA